MGAPITSLLLPCRGGKGQEVGRVSDGEETVELELWYIDGIDICSGLWFEFANPHYSLSLSEDSIINIVRGTHAPVNTKVLFAFSGGFAPKSIRKICTLHQYESENLALLKLSQCFSPTQHISKNVKLKVNIFILVILFVSQWFITLILYFDLGPVKDHDFTANDDLEVTSRILSQQSFAHHCLIYKKISLCMRTHSFRTGARTRSHIPVISCFGLPLLFSLFANRAALEASGWLLHR